MTNNYPSEFKDRRKENKRTATRRHSDPKPERAKLNPMLIARLVVVALFLIGLAWIFSR